ncbi:MAG: putative Zn-dependent protease [Porticoccaceae bacterium]|jgi:predicted Zn-dependent protease
MINAATGDSLCRFDLFDNLQKGDPSTHASVYFDLSWRIIGLVITLIGKRRLWLVGLGGTVVGGLAWFLVAVLLNSGVDSSEDIVDRALTAIQRRDLDGIQVAIKELWRDEGRHNELSVLIGVRHLVLNRPAPALEEFSAASPDGRLRLPLLIATGEALYRVGQLQGAERCLRQAVTEAPDNADVHRWLATIYYDQGRTDRMLYHLDTLSRVSPEDFRPHRMRGVVFQDLGNHQGAISAFQQAAALTANPVDLTEVLLPLALSQISLKEYQKAVQTLQRCQPTVAALSARADCAWNLGESEQAEKLLARAESTGPLQGAGKRLRTRMLLEQGTPEVAVSILKKLTAEDASDSEAEYLLALAYQQLGERSLSRQHLKRSEEVKALKLKLTELSQLAMREAKNADVREEMAVICENLGMKEMAQLWRTAAAACRASSPEEISTF